MKAVPLNAEVRKVIGKKIAKLRKEGLLPVTVYGKDIKSESLMVPVKDFILVYKQAGETGLVDLKYGKDSQHCLISDVQIHPLTRQILHVQFHAVKLTEKIKAKVPLELVGDSPAVANNTGLLLHTLNEVEVEALPTDLPDKIDVDVSGLLEIGQQLTVGDLKISVEILIPKEELIVKVVPAVSEEAKKEEAEKVAAEAAKATPEEAAASTEAPQSSDQAA